MTDRKEVYEAIDTERTYQESRWPSPRPTTTGGHTITEWLVFIQDYVQEALHIESREEYDVAEDKALNIMRKVAGMAVACMEEHGAPKRK